MFTLDFKSLNKTRAYLQPNACKLPLRLSRNLAAFLVYTKISG
ncbi:hypothetical protein LEP1GSC132_4315 [Leptospira kirschneri str. 200803703]|nr:hypothetical protein LEP1GSC018_2587 [Leptospira kirschneri str. 2008720114]EMN24586.1 hypothetical protein LEP1GSC065_3530 [Leptospira kirschneri serovar Sokoine str. RM1]EMO68501.1 hypothetical protein LEP1GSC132_4315 [Leptospira kirschneri str. 200803703]